MMMTVARYRVVLRVHDAVPSLFLALIHSTRDHIRCARRCMDGKKRGWKEEKYSSSFFFSLRQTRQHVNRHRRWVMMTHRRGRPLFHVCLFMRFVNGLREKQGENKTVRAKLRAGRLERERERACGQDEKRKAAPSLARVTALLCGRAGEGESGHRFIVTHVRGERVHATHVTTTAQQQ